MGKRELEDCRLIEQIESYLVKKRRYSYKIPEKNTPVILLFSGGLDTVISAAILMKVFKLQIYPFYIKRGQRRIKKEIDAVNFYSKLYNQRFPTLWKKVKIVDSFIPPKQIRYSITLVSNNIVRQNSLHKKGIPMYTSLMANFAVEYAYFLQINLGVKIRDIFMGLVNNDGNYMSYETFTALRSIMLNICFSTHDWSWQVSSIALEKELGLCLEKYDLIRWAVTQKIPIEKSWSCYWDYTYHCGNCDGCTARKIAFREAHSQDKTIYLSEIRSHYLKRILEKIKV
ncbi:MAG: 7-cyano-7-deazaguanine synthase [Patescibacteria group bacterium]|nr:7-cyano-7-deazaguanine synthase [Patescibacteria group bacterium]